MSESSYDSRASHTGDGLLEFRAMEIDRWHLERESEEPNIARSWEFWNLHTVPRFVVQDDGDIVKCEPGVPGQRYSVLGTPVSELRDFGIGIAMYFKTLIYVCVACIAAGGINVLAMRYFWSDEYGGQQEDMIYALRGSAACARETICLDTNCEETAFASVCPFNIDVAYADLGAFGLLVVGLWWMSRTQERVATELDEAEQTAQDYTVRIEDPSPDATDPDVWRDFFEKKLGLGQVRAVTVSRKNGTLIELLADRRRIRQQLEFHFDEKEKYTEGDTIRPAGGLKGFLQGLGVGCDFSYWALKMHEVNMAIMRQLARKSIRKAAKVYVTFNTEKAQRRCLNEMTDGIINTAFDKDMTSWLTGRRVHPRFFWINADGSPNQLAVVEAPEPSDVIWKNQSVPLWVRAVEQAIGFGLCALVVFLAALVIEELALAGQHAAVALFISGSNSVLPEIMKLFTEIESHLTFSSKQTSMLIKLVIARWMTTCIIYRMITDTEDLAREETLTQIYNILFADAVTTPVIRLLDIGGVLGRHLIAPGSKLPVLSSIFPGAKTQAQMDMAFQGTEWSLAERFTDMTKTIFVSFFNMTVFPAGVFITAFAMIVNFWVDKYCLLRIWRPEPAVGAEMVTTNRSYMAMVLLFHFMAALHTYAAWPFDDYYDTGVPVSTTVNGTLPLNVTRENVYAYVNDTMTPDGIFIVEKHDWMTGAQKKVVTLFSSLSIVVFVTFMVLYFGGGIYDFYRTLTTGIYSEPGQDQGTPHSALKGEDAVDAYVPMIRCAGQKYPLLAAKIDFNLDHLPFQISKKELPHFNLYDEMCEPRYGGHPANAAVFSIVRMYEVETGRV